MQIVTLRENIFATWTKKANIQSNASMFFLKKTMWKWLMQEEIIYISLKAEG